jgi:hypothetical protein
MDNAELEKRLTVLQDIEAIKRLKAEYCDICDDAHNQDRIVAIFAEDGIWEGKAWACCSGVKIRASSSCGYYALIDTEELSALCGFPDAGSMSRGLDLNMQGT